MGMVLFEGYCLLLENTWEHINKNLFTIKSFWDKVSKTIWHTQTHMHLHTSYWLSLINTQHISVEHIYSPTYGCQRNGAIFDTVQNYCWVSNNAFGQPSTNVRNTDQKRVYLCPQNLYKDRILYKRRTLLWITKCKTAKNQTASLLEYTCGSSDTHHNAHENINVHSRLCDGCDCNPNGQRHQNRHQSNCLMCLASQMFTDTLHF